MKRLVKREGIVFITEIITSGRDASQIGVRP